MTRNILEFPKEEPKMNYIINYDKKTCLINAITPIISGGVEPSENDLKMIIWPPSIRDHWGGCFCSPEEAEAFGTLSLFL